MENKTGNYFKYAIGEIVLVVIGILIALFINNKNKESSHETKITNILIEMQSDIITNIENSYMIFDYQIYTDSISKLILNNIFTAADYRLGTAETIGYNYRDFRMITNGFDNLKTNFNHIPKKYKHLLPTIKEMYSINKITIDDYNNRLRKIVYKNTDSMDKFDWILDRNNDITSEAEIEYRLNDSDYKKMVVSYMSSRANLFNLSNDYRLDAINLYNNISEAIGSKDTIKDVLENKRLDILNTHIGVYELKETSNDNMWDKEITFKIIAGELSINATKKSPIATLLARNSKVFYSSQSELLVIFNRPDTSQVYINRIYGNSFAIYERKATE